MCTESERLLALKSILAEFDERAINGPPEEMLENLVKADHMFAVHKMVVEKVEAEERERKRATAAEKRAAAKAKREAEKAKQKKEADEAKAAAKKEKQRNDARLRQQKLRKRRREEMGDFQFKALRALERRDTRKNAKTRQFLRDMNSLFE